MSRGTRRPFASAARVAAVATALVAAASAGAVAGLDALVVHRLDAQVDLRVTAELKEDAAGPPGASDADDLDSGVPLYHWVLDARGRMLTASTEAPPFPPSAFWGSAGLRTVTIGATAYRVAALHQGSTWLVAGESLSAVHHVVSVLLAAEGLAAPVVLVAVFLGALIIGVRTATPVEAARRRQLEFTADASHELRTPLSVIEAELSLARTGPRDPADYRATLDRIGGESRRLRRIVEDLLWLARSDAAPPPPAGEPVELGTIAETCARRFDPVARGRHVDLTIDVDPARPVLVHAPPEWMDRLVGVLVDNACRYAGPGGQVAVSVHPEGGRGVLAVEDSGPGIPAEERGRLFDRFHRATEQHEGHGLGLAIADSVVRGTGGRWRIGSSALGGARLEVSWPRR